MQKKAIAAPQADIVDELMNDEELDAKAAEHFAAARRGELGEGDLDETLAKFEGALND